jgi:hypothetical protein
LPPLRPIVENSSQRSVGVVRSLFSDARVTGTATSKLTSSYANFCNATSTREEVVLNFGVNQNWERTPAEMEIELEHRLILSPFAAKRLNQLLSKLMTEYEARYGELK